MKVNVIFDSNGALYSGELPENFPTDLNEISGFDKSVKTTEFLKLSVDGLPYFCVVSPYFESDKKFFSACFILQYDVAKKASPDIDTAFENSVAVCRNGIHNIATVSARVAKLLEEYERYDDKKLVNSQINNCYKVLRSLQNVQEMYLYMNSKYIPQAFMPYEILEPILAEVKCVLGRTHKTLTFNAECKTAKIFADSKRFENIFLNLISNAIIFSGDESSISVSLKQISDNVVITVSDDGFGMPIESIPKSFEAGFTTESDNYKQGLGLYLAKRFAETAGGSIMIASKENEGTTVTLTIPETTKDAISLESKTAEYRSGMFSPVDVALSDIYDF